MGHLPNINPLEPLVTTYRKFFGENAAVIFDVGTRDGDDANYLFNNLNVYGANVYAIDANPEMCKNTKINYSNKTLNPCCFFSALIGGQTVFFGKIS